MPVSAGISILIILAVALTTFATRVTPFLVFPKGKEIPETIQYLGKVLTPDYDCPVSFCNSSFCR